MGFLFLCLGVGSVLVVWFCWVAFSVIVVVVLAWMGFGMVVLLLAGWVCLVGGCGFCFLDFGWFVAVVVVCVLLLLAGISVL